MHARYGTVKVQRRIPEVYSLLRRSAIISVSDDFCILSERSRARLSLDYGDIDPNRRVLTSKTGNMSTLTTYLSKAGQALKMPMEQPPSPPPHTYLHTY